MKITAGFLKGRTLPTRVLPGVRPTGALVREALFDILGPGIAESSFLDAAGGTGLVAVEALSRGAARVLILERNRAAASAIRDLLTRLELKDRLRLIQTDALKFTSNERFDTVFVDPPYDQDPEPWVERLFPLASGQLVLQHSSRVAPPPAPGAALPPRSRRYGDTSLTFYPVVVDTKDYEDRQELGEESSGVVNTAFVGHQ